MKTYKSSDLTNKRAEVLREAEKNGVIIQQCRTNGDVISELVMVSREVMFETVDSCSLANGKFGDNKQTAIWNATQPNNCTCGRDDCEDCSYDY